jgi:hypothetical protein
MTRPTATERLTMARQYAQSAADSARAACALLQQRRDGHWHVLALDLEEWACAQIARLSALQTRLRDLEKNRP